MFNETIFLLVSVLRFEFCHDVTVKLLLDSHTPFYHERFGIGVKVVLYFYELCLGVFFLAVEKIPDVRFNP